MSHPWTWGTAGDTITVRDSEDRFVGTVTISAADKKTYAPDPKIKTPKKPKKKR